MNGTGDVAGVEELRYPIGRFRPSGPLSPGARAAALESLATLPERLREAVGGLTDEQLDTPYRPGGWTVRQVVHHLADSHVNSYVRFKLALTEERPLVRPYDEARWAEERDARGAPVDASLALLGALHARWVAWLRELPEEAWSRELVHPESGPGRVDTLLELYAWHSRHHVAHVAGLRERSGW